MHQPAGTQASAWLVEEHGLDRPEAERIVAAALRQRGVHPGVGASAQPSASPAATGTLQTASRAASSDSAPAAPDPLAAVRQALKENEQLRRSAVVRRQGDAPDTGPSPTPTPTPQPRGPQF
jgi:hypothetical protein